jgi:hypothetical protein
MTPKPYDPLSIPERTDGGSKFFTGTAPNGLAAEPGQNLAAIAGRLVAARIQTAQPAPPPETRLELYAVVPEGDAYRLRRRGLLTGPRVYDIGPRPTKRAKLKSTPGQLIDSVLEGVGEGHETCRDQEIWKALEALASYHSLGGRALRDLNDAVARALALRAGLEPPHPFEMPQEHLMAEPVELPRERVEAAV